MVVLDECDLAVRYKKSTYQKPQIERKGFTLDDQTPFVNYKFLTNNTIDYEKATGLDISCNQYKTTNDFTNRQSQLNKGCKFSENEDIQKKLDFYKDKMFCDDLLGLYNFKILTEVSRSQIYFISSYPKNKERFSFFNFKNNINYSIAMPWSTGTEVLDQSKVVDDLDDTEKLELQFNSLSPSTPSVKLKNNSSSNSLNSANSSNSNVSTISQQTLVKCDALECFMGQIGTQPMILKKVKDEGSGLGSSYFSGTITYTNAGNTPIPVKWRQVNSVGCGPEGIYQCRDITIEEDIPNGGTLRQPIKYNKNNKQEEKDQWTWTNKDGKMVLTVSLTQVESL